MKISRLREKRGLTQKELARLMGVSQQAISRIESSDYEGFSLKDCGGHLSPVEDWIRAREIKLTVRLTSDFPRAVLHLLMSNDHEPILRIPSVAGLLVP